ncbi:MAG TPA: carboxypeptidase-like regulatory domain-containing protein, partial [Flavisolibacter sp.]|nr:carboxypeptidase-like regulatory domain-containing protein [Flavisolibacter sp.]
MRNFLIGIFLLLLSNLAIAQQPSLSGTVTDTLGKKPLANAVVTLLQKKDSTLYKFTRTDKDGNFQLPKVDSGKYVLLVSFPRFADFADEVVVKPAGNNSLGTIPLTLKSQLLDAVVIRSAGAIRIKGDTTEFVADSFHVKEGATVEELLKKLPGFQVNSKGEITAQGQRVQKVLVDGEEFFGDDPTMATKNIGAKAVDKVQVFDNKSEQQNLTGITTGSEGKTVNIKLKEDKKTGAFGKAEIGSDFDKLLDARLLYNKFIGKMKFSVYGTKSKTNTGSLNWQDQRKLGFENDFEYDELNGYYFSFGTSDDFSDWSLKGLPDAYTAGALYINKWNNDKQGVNGSYRFNRLGTSNIASKYTQSIIPGRLINTSTLTRSNGLNQQHAINFKYEWKLDSLASLKLVTAGTNKATTSFNNTNTDIINETDNKETINKGNTSYDSKRIQSDNQIQYKQLFHKKDRQLLSTIRYGITNDDQKNFIYSQADFYTGGNLDSSRLQDQQKINNGSSTTLGAKITYSEPLNDKWSLVGEYSYNQNNSTSHKNTFDKDFNGKYEILNQGFSNNFDLRASSNSGTLITKYIYKKIRMAFGSGLSS